MCKMSGLCGLKKTSLANVVTHQAPCSVVARFVLALSRVYVFQVGCTDVRTPCVKIRTTYIRPTVPGGSITPFLLDKKSSACTLKKS